MLGFSHTSFSFSYQVCNVVGFWVIFGLMSLESSVFVQNTVLWHLRNRYAHLSPSEDGGFDPSR